MMAEYPYAEREWTMEQIGEALNVAQSTVTEDLRNLSTIDKLNRAKTITNPKGAGRPKGSKGKKRRPKVAAVAKEHPAALYLDDKEAQKLVAIFLDRFL